VRPLLVGLAMTAVLGMPAQAEDEAGVTPLGVPDMRSARSLAVEGKALDIVGIGLATAGARRSLRDAADALAGQDADLSVRADDLGLRVAVAGDVLFAFDSADIRPEAEPTLVLLAQLIGQSGPAGVVVEGHTDGKGSGDYNQALSERRAQAVVDWLVTRAGQARARLTARGRGETEPVAPNTEPGGGDDPEGRRRNRRVELVFPEPPPGGP